MTNHLKFYRPRRFEKSNCSLLTCFCYFIKLFHVKTFSWLLPNQHMSKFKNKRHLISFLIVFKLGVETSKPRQLMSSAFIRDHSYARKVFRKTNISYLLIRARTCAYVGKSDCFFGKFCASTK